MARKKKEPRTTTIVWWEDLPQELIDLIDENAEGWIDGLQQERKARQAAEKMKPEKKRAEK